MAPKKKGKRKGKLELKSEPSVEDELLPQYVVLENQYRNLMKHDPERFFMIFKSTIDKLLDGRILSPVVYGWVQEMQCMMSYFTGDHKVAQKRALNALKAYQNNYLSIKTVEAFRELGEYLLVVEKKVDSASKLCSVGIDKFKDDDVLLKLNTRIGGYIAKLKEMELLIEQEAVEESIRASTSVPTHTHTQSESSSSSSSSATILSHELKEGDDDKETTKDKDIPTETEVDGYKLCYDKSCRGSLHRDDVSIPIKLLHFAMKDMNEFNSYRQLCSSKKGLLTVLHVMKDSATGAKYVIADDCYTFREYMEKLKKQFYEETDGSKEAWGRFIPTKFREIFGEAAETLTSMYDDETKPIDSIGNLGTLYISMDEKARILPYVQGQDCQTKDVDCFLSLMLSMAYGPFGDQDGLEDFNFPWEMKSVIFFFRRYKSSLPAKCVLNHPFFWTIKLKLEYPKRCIENIKSLGSNLSLLNSFFTDDEYDDWKSKLDGVYSVIWSHGNPKINVSDELLTGLEMLGFIRIAKYNYKATIVRYFSNVISHINDDKFRKHRVKERYSDPEVLEYLTGLFPSFYTTLYEGVASLVCSGKLGPGNFDGIFGLVTKEAGFAKL